MPIITISDLYEVHWEQSRMTSFELDNSIHIWRIKIEDHYNRFEELLTKQELEKMNRYHNQYGRNQFAVSRGALRYLSGKYMHQSPLALQMDTNQKPYWQDAEQTTPIFNIAHSGEYVLIAFANEAIGIDVEKINPQFDYEEILTRCFHQSEIKMIQKANDPRAAFYLHWTRKEALLKATGKGINNELPRVPCINGHHPVQGNIIGSEKDWIVSSFEMESTYAVSFAYTSEQIKPCLCVIVN